jgi:hypothetical protein
LSTLGDPHRALLFLAHGEGRISEIKRQKQRQAIYKETGVYDGTSHLP